MLACFSWAALCSPSASPPLVGSTELARLSWAALRQPAFRGRPPARPPLVGSTELARLSWAAPGSPAFCGRHSARHARLLLVGGLNDLAGWHSNVVLDIAVGVMYG